MTSGGGVWPGGGVWTGGGGKWEVSPSKRGLGAVWIGDFGPHVLSKRGLDTVISAKVI